ncbi:MAG: carboxypeptidase-like regulatory domain-containing protein [Anaerolineae bacterium]
MRIQQFLVVFFLGVTVWAGCAAPTPSPTVPSPTLPPDAVFGVVRDADGPVAGATVRVQATDNKTTTAADGSFLLSGLTATTPISVTAWAEGYFVGWTSAAPGPEPVTITIKPYYTTDNPDYGWFSLEGAEGSLSCSHCMPAYSEWQADAHSQSAVNPRFLTMYNGTDVAGNQSPPTRFGYHRDYGSFPLRPDPNQPYYGPGYKLDFPDTAVTALPVTSPPQQPNRTGLTPPTPIKSPLSRPMGYSASSATRSATWCWTRPRACPIPICRARSPCACIALRKDSSSSSATLTM